VTVDATPYRVLARASKRLRSDHEVAQSALGYHPRLPRAYYPLPFFCPFLSTASAAFWAVMAAYRSPFSRALELTSISRVAVSSIFHPQSRAVMHHVKSARLMSGPVLP
jgi:hypothetical protein